MVITRTHNLTCKLNIVLIGLVKRKKFKFSDFALRFTILYLIICYSVHRSYVSGFAKFGLIDDVKNLFCCLNFCIPISFMCCSAPLSHSGGALLGHPFDILWWKNELVNMSLSLCSSLCTFFVSMIFNYKLWKFTVRQIIILMIRTYSLTWLIVEISLGFIN